MLQTSAPFGVAIRKSTRTSSSKVKFAVIDVTAASDAEVEVSNEQYFVDGQSIVTNPTSPEFQMATFEDDYFKLDGSMYLAPDNLSPSYKLGWISDVMSDENGVFLDYENRPVIDITFDDPHSSLGLGLFFGTNDVCSDFEVKWYRGDVEAESLLIENNDQQEVNISKPVDNYTRVLITFMKTINPYRYARLMRIEFGLNEVFTDDSIISGTVIEEVDPVSAALSINTLKFTVLNKDQRFNMLNQDGIYRYLQTRQQIKAQSGVMLDDGTYEYVDLGVFYLSNWQNATGLKASLEATDVIGLLDKTTYWKSKFWVNTQIADIINDIVSDAGNFNVSISPDIAGISLTGYIDVKSHRNALLDVLVAARCTARVERDGSIKVFKVNYNEGVDEIANDLIIGEPSIELLPLITSVQVTEYSYGTNVPVGEVYSSDFNVSGTSTILIPFGRAVSDAIISVSEGATIVGTPKISAVAAEVVISANGPVTVKVTGQPRSESMRVVSASLSTVDAGAIPQVAELSNSNKLISGNGLAVAQHILDYSQKRIKQTIRYWNNPAVQAGDIVDIETMFQSFKSGAIEKQEIEFAPSLNAKLEVVG